MSRKRALVLLPSYNEDVLVRLKQLWCYKTTNRVRDIDICDLILLSGRTGYHKHGKIIEEAKERNMPMVLFNPNRIDENNLLLLDTEFELPTEVNILYPRSTTEYIERGYMKMWEVQGYNLPTKINPICSGLGTSQKPSYDFDLDLPEGDLLFPKDSNEDVYWYDVIRMLKRGYRCFQYDFKRGYLLWEVFLLDDPGEVEYIGK